MHAKPCSSPAEPQENSKPAPLQQARPPQFQLTPEQVIERCIALGLPLMCAGEVLALMDLMVLRELNLLRLATAAKVGRATIRRILSLNQFPCTLVRYRLFDGLKIDSVEFALLATLATAAAQIPLPPAEVALAVADARWLSAAPFRRPSPAP